MTTPFLARRLALHPARAWSPRNQAVLTFGDDQVFARLHSVGVQAAMAILLSIFGLGSAMGQSIAPDMTLDANARATRDRVFSEMHEAREDGRVRRWSPLFVELPSRTRPRRSRFDPGAMHQHESASAHHMPGHQSPEPPPAASRATD